MRGRSALAADGSAEEESTVARVRAVLARGQLVTNVWWGRRGIRMITGNGVQDDTIVTILVHGEVRC